MLHRWGIETRRRSGYRPVREPLTQQVVAAHLSGRHTIGQYLLWPDATVSFAVIDLDLTGAAMEALRAGHGDDVSALRCDSLRRYLVRLRDASRSLGLEMFAEDSGGRGAHLWVFFEPRRSARAARALLAQVVIAAGQQPPDVRVEIFPKQSRHGRRGLSSLVKLPLGLHRATLRPCPMLDEQLRPMEDPAIALGTLRPTDPSVVDAILGRRLVALPAPDLDVAEPLPPLPEHGTPRDLAQALRQIEGGRPGREACERMISGCAVLAALVSRAYEVGVLPPEESRAIVYSLGLVGPGGFAREVLVAAGASMKELDRTRTGLPAPVGCKRLRALAPEGVSCSGCDGARKALPYPTPALFAVGVRDASAPEHLRFAPWLADDIPVVSPPMDAVREVLERIDHRLARLEGQGYGDVAEEEP